MPGKLQDRVALITGGNSGIGEATARVFIKEGAKVALLARRETEGLAVQQCIRADGGDATFFQCDVTNKAAVESAVAQTISAYGGIHVLINNAGGGAREMFPEESDETWERVLRVNLTACFLTCRAVWAHLIRAGGGTIVNVSSLAAVSAVSEAVLELRYRRIRVLPPICKQKLYPELRLTVLHATERATPKDRDRIDWKLITDLPIRSRKDAVEKLRWYAMRWKIETFHKILKSGFKAEEVRLRAAERIVNLIAILCILSWRIFWMTMSNRITPAAPPELAFTPAEMYLLDQLVKDHSRQSVSGPTLSLYLTKLAQLGGYLARAKDPPPGNIVMWRGLSRLTDIQLGFLLGAQLVGN